MDLPFLKSIFKGEDEMGLFVRFKIILRDYYVDVIRITSPRQLWKDISYSRRPIAVKGLEFLVWWTLYSIVVIVMGLLALTIMFGITLETAFIKAKDHLIKFFR